MLDQGTVQHELRPELGPGERLLWSGMPRQGVVFRPIDLFLIPFILLWAGIPTFAALGLLKSDRGVGIGDFFFLPFILIGAYLLVGRFIVDAKQRARTFYGVTNQRVLIVRTWWRRRTTSLKLGFLPDVSLSPGPLGIMAKSGTLSYEVCHRLVDRGLGQNLWVGVGGDPVKGTRFADILPFMLTDPHTHGIVVIGEIGGSEEEELAAAMRALRCAKPVYALIAGRTVREGVTMGHAGAIIAGDIGTIASKTAALAGVGAQVFTRIRDLVDAVVAGTGGELVPPI